MEKLRMTSPDLTEANLDKVAELFPAVITETLDAEGNPHRAVDFDLLRQELSDHIVDGPQERYRLDWPGKRAAAFAANAPIAKTLRPVREESVDFDTTKNLIIEGDNLDALKLLQESYLGKVKLIYIDPPYNTGHDFVYEDDFSTASTEYLQRSEQLSSTGERLVANPESNGRFHSDWLDMIYPRLKLAKNLLRDDGIVLISIDDNEVANLRKVCDELFGAQNFVGQFVWTTKNAARGVPPRTMLMSNHEYVVAYGREATLVRFKGINRDESDFSNPDRDPRGLWRSESMKATGSQDNFFTIVDPVTRNKYHANWAFSRSRIADMIADGLIIFPSDPSGTPRQKKFIDTYVNDRKAFVSNLGWFSTENATKALMRLFDGKKVFDFPKPLDLLRFLVEQATSGTSGGIVLDLFSGSGSLPVAVLEQNSVDGLQRPFIAIQLDEATTTGSAAQNAGFPTISGLARERVERAGRIITADASLLAKPVDVGFRSLHVDTTNMTDVTRAPDETDQLALDELEPSVKSGRSGEDVLFQVLLDWGLELTMPIVKETIAGQEIFDVEDGTLIACLDKSLTQEVVHSIAAREPIRAVFRDDGFDSDSQRINVEQIFREVSPSTEVKAI